MKLIRPDDALGDLGYSDGKEDWRSNIPKTLSGVPFLIRFSERVNCLNRSNVLECATGAVTVRLAPKRRHLTR